MHYIRPYKIFALIESLPSERVPVAGLDGRTSDVQIQTEEMHRVVNVPLPKRRGAGSLTLLETFVLIAATRIIGARSLFEFGTFLGGTTLNLALNTPPEAEILTLDLDRPTDIEQHPEDAPLTEIHLASKATLDFLGSPVASKVRVLTGNSISFDFSQWKRSMDFVFIDGGHDLATVKSDSENALEMISMSKPSCIMWHDYGNPSYRELSSYLDRLSESQEIFSVGDTMLCAWFNDPNALILPSLHKAD